MIEKAVVGEKNVRLAVYISMVVAKRKHHSPVFARHRALSFSARHRETYVRWRKKGVRFLRIRCVRDNFAHMESALAMVTPTGKKLALLLRSAKKETETHAKTRARSCAPYTVPVKPNDIFVGDGRPLNYGPRTSTS